jgi:hypothetical protein
MKTFTRPRLTRSEFFSLQCKDVLSKHEHWVISTAQIIDDPAPPPDEDKASLATMGPLFAALGEPK